MWVNPDDISRDSSRQTLHTSVTCIVKWQQNNVVVTQHLAAIANRYNEHMTWDYLIKMKAQDFFFFSVEKKWSFFSEGTHSSGSFWPPPCAQNVDDNKDAEQGNGRNMFLLVLISDVHQPNIRLGLPLKFLVMWAEASPSCLSPCDLDFPLLQKYRCRTFAFSCNMQKNLESDHSCS